jgi:CheY-like chemotaxis protein
MKGADLIRRLLAFARRQPLQPRRVDLNELVGKMTTLLSRTLGQHIDIELDLSQEVWPVIIDPAQLESSLANLATNARDAMPNGGKLRFATGNRNLDKDYAARHSEVRPGDYALVEVSDSGTGIPQHMMARIFEPFFTTKEPGKGTGLGLSMVFGFIKQSGGHINVYSEEGVGTTFRLYLPRTTEDVASESATISEATARGKGETVLIVEDNFDLRSSAVRMLTDLGFRVIEANDAATALLALEQEHVDLLFTDVVMPGGVGGHDLVKAALARRPSLRIVLTSGFPDAMLRRDPAAADLKLITKPYRKQDLARTLRQALDGLAAA